MRSDSRLYKSATAMQAAVAMKAKKMPMTTAKPGLGGDPLRLGIVWSIHTHHATTASCRGMKNQCREGLNMGLQATSPAIKGAMAIHG